MFRVVKGLSTRIVLVLVLTLLCMGVSWAGTGFTTQTFLEHTGTSGDPSTVYQDGVGGNPDIGIEICDQATAAFAGAFYAFQNGTTWVSVPISYNAAGATLSPVSGGTCKTAAGGFFTVSPSDLSSPYEPDVKRAAFPGKLFIGWDDASGNPGTVSNFEFADTNATLSGTWSTVTRSFDESSGKITISDIRHTPTAVSGSIGEKAYTDSNFGVASTRQIVMGVCDGNDGTGISCEDGLVVDDTSDIPAVLTPTFASGINDQVTYNKSVVINGLAANMCIGPNLRASITSVTPDPVYYSQNLSFNVRVSNPSTSNEFNGGNVGVTTDFSIYVEIYPQSNPSSPVYTNTIAISSAVSAKGGQVDNALTWPAFALSGDYTIRLTVDSTDSIEDGGDIAECDDSDNQASTSFTLLPITLPTVFIDGVETDAFEAPNVPYNLTINLKNSDNTTLNDADVVITENNGMNLMSPTQIYTLTTNFTTNAQQQAGINVTTTARMVSDGDGNVSFTIIPAYNNLYGDAYSYTNISTILGNYSLSFSGTESGGQQFIFIFNGGDPEDAYPFTITNVSNTGPFSSKELPNFDVVSQVLDFIYRTFTNFLDVAVQ